MDEPMAGRFLGEIRLGMLGVSGHSMNMLIADHLCSMIRAGWCLFNANAVDTLS